MIDYVRITGGAIYINKPVMNILIRPESASNSITAHALRKNFQSQKSAYEIMMKLSDDSPELRKLFAISQTLRLSSVLGTMLQTGMSNTELQNARQYTRESSNEFMSSKKIPLTKKLIFICKVYLPLPFSRVLLGSWNMLKKIRDKIRRKN